MGSYAIAVIVGGICQILAIAGLILWLRARISQGKQDLADKITAFVTAPGEGQISPLAELTELVAHRFSVQLSTQLLAKLGAGKAAIARQENALQGDMFTDSLAQQSPLLGMIAAAFPSVTKRLAKNPSAMPALMNLLQGLGTGPGPGNTGSSGNGSSVADRIHHQT
jgi:hypothetical protein